MERKGGGGGGGVYNFIKVQASGIIIVFCVSSVLYGPKL